VADILNLHLACRWWCRCGLRFPGRISTIQCTAGPIGVLRSSVQAKDYCGEFLRLGLLCGVKEEFSVRITMDGIVLPCAIFGVVEIDIFMSVKSDGHGGGGVTR
jgi:hypothetical protein